MSHTPRQPFLVFGAPMIGDEEIAEVLDCLSSGWLGSGPKVDRFEAAFAEYKQAPGAIAVNSCTAALHLSMLGAGLAPGDEVITTPLTFCATVNAIIHAGATPVLADVDPVTMNIDPGAVAAALTPRTRAVVPVHFAGRPCAMDAIMTLADEHDLRVIEDCAHAIETEHRGAKAGTIGDYGCFSFYVTKNVATGEGGMILARCTEAAARLRTLALHGLSRDAWTRYRDDGYKHYAAVEVGFKYNMMDLQAALGLHQLARVERNWQRRLEIWERYQDAFADLPLGRPAAFEPGSRHGLHLYTLLVDERVCVTSRDAFIDAMTRRGIGVGVHYLALPEHPVYRERFGWTPDRVPHAARIGRQTVSLPLSAALSDRDVDDVISAVRDVLDEAARARSSHAPHAPGARRAA
ncbi:MAG: DegT/DnrJ/EryC1/StrS family aminotransferase [Planctomycetes bacterium]|nr:DegT/DnrJ/EryC1/StrS family aminotransferase [Planctomycetota bacterium]